MRYNDIIYSSVAYIIAIENMIDGDLLQFCYETTHIIT
jgi:hypothetical protein